MAFASLWWENKIHVSQGTGLLIMGVSTACFLYPLTLSLSFFNRFPSCLSRFSVCDASSSVVYISTMLEYRVSETQFLMKHLV